MLLGRDLSAPALRDRNIAGSSIQSIQMLSPGEMLWSSSPAQGTSHTGQALLSSTQTHCSQYQPLENSLLRSNSAFVFQLSSLILYRKMINCPLAIPSKRVFTSHYIDITLTVYLQQNIEFQLFGESLIIDGVFLTLLMIMSKLSSHSTFWTNPHCPQAPISFSSTQDNILKPQVNLIKNHKCQWGGWQNFTWKNTISEIISETRKVTTSSHFSALTLKCSKIQSLTFAQL